MNSDAIEQVLLVGCQTKDQLDDDFDYSMSELESLTKTAKGQVVMTVTQKRSVIDPATYIGRGKVSEIEEIINELDVDLIIFNDELTPSQVRNLSASFEIRIVDRTQLILDIFAKRAQSREGILQVELAQLNYLLPRLKGQGTALSRLGGGIGTRGPGETKLESDRRHIRRRMDEIKTQLSTILSHRERYRERRKQNQTIQIALVGYTNAGKSTLLNKLTNADTLEEDLLFATLDPTTRKLKLPSGLNVLLSDTVGFIQDLPTTLIAAFRSTLEEVCEADFILHVVDGSHPNHFQHEQTVLSLLDELEVKDVTVLTVYNKRDKIHEDFYPSSKHNTIKVSAFSKEDRDSLLKEIERLLKEKMEFYRVFILPTEGKLLAECVEKSIVLEKEWNDNIQKYEVSGYIHPSLGLSQKLKERME
ncbi:GTPase HflX [Bacillus sp. FJAT-45350]|uniref:GTPase HflX n=1 Tax=Bacillus sp. FJAT-45350 TaxID=2011014 RepID=UPI000BB747EA